MTLEPNGAPGMAVLVPSVAAIATPAALASEAEALWAAERSSTVTSGIGADWGCVGVLFAPTVPADWRAWWDAYFRSHASPVPPVNEAGALRITWPITTDKTSPVDVDLILATATRAEKVRPGPIEVADAWLGQHAGHERYFFENVRHGIRTPFDGAIWKQIEARKPAWLRNETYANAIEILRSESA